MLLTEQEFFDTEMRMGIHLDNPPFVSLCDYTAKSIKDAFGTNIKTILDYGAGMGVYSRSLVAEGYDVSIFELFEPHKKYIRERLPHIPIVDEPITTDMLFWIEVSEHMTDSEINALFKKIQPTWIYHSSTPDVTDNDENWGHINIKEQSEWVKFFKKKGYDLVFETNIPTTWTKIYKKNETIKTQTKSK